MGPILKNGFIATLCFVQMDLVIVGNTRVKNMMMTAFDDADRVDLNISQMLDDFFGGDAAFAKSTLFMKALCVYPTGPGLSISYLLNRFHLEITIDEKLKKKKVVRGAWKSAARKMTTVFLLNLDYLIRQSQRMYSIYRFKQIKLSSLSIITIHFFVVAFSLRILGMCMAFVEGRQKQKGAQMKHDLFFDLITKRKQNPKLMRKIKILAAVGIAGFLLTGIVAIWAGLSAFNYIAKATTDIAQSSMAQTQVENLATELKSLPQFKALDCWSKTQSLMSVQPWYERPVLENLKGLKAACLEGPQKVCKGVACKDSELTNTDGQMI
jgi:hypothetical protein